MINVTSKMLLIFAYINGFAKARSKAPGHEKMLGNNYFRWGANEKTTVSVFYPNFWHRRVPWLYRLAQPSQFPFGTTSPNSFSVSVSTMTHYNEATGYVRRIQTSYHFDQMDSTVSRSVSVWERVDGVWMIPDLDTPLAFQIEPNTPNYWDLVKMDRDAETPSEGELLELIELMAGRLPKGLVA